MTAVAFDFRTPPPTELEAKTIGWLQQACTLAPRTWSRVLPFSAEMAVDKVTSVSATVAIDALPAGAVAFRMTVDRVPECQPIIAIARPFLIALINGALGSPPTELPSDRALSTVERSVCDFLVTQLILDVLSDSWPASDRPKFTVAMRGEPRGVSTLPPNDLVLLCTLTFKGPFGESQILAVFPRSAPISELVKPAFDPVAIQSAPRDQLEALVQEMPIDVTIPLGNTQITMLQLAMLRPGDVVVLGQKVSEPLPARVGGVDKFSVWPGAVGRRQAVQIDALVET